jgi:chemotaxis protein histidine kinase CheA
MSAELEPMQENAPAAPTFDFGADDQTNALLLQDAQTFIVGTTARIMAAKHAHDLCANNKNGTWGKWCATVGISRDTGDRFVNIAAQCGNIQLDGKSILDVQPMKLLYAAAKPSTPEAVKQAVFSGDITTYKEYQDLMAQFKAEKERADAAEAREEEAWNLRESASQKYNAALADVNNLAAANQRKNKELEAVKKDLRDAQDALKHQPITGVVDKEEVKRQAEALSRNAVQEARQQAAEAQARLRQYQEDAEGLLAPAQACAQQAQFIADSVRAMYLNWFGSAVAADASLAQMGTPLYAVCGEIMSSLEEENTINPTAAGSEEDAEREALFE